jgi:hypothetical protein
MALISRLMKTSWKRWRKGNRDQFFRQQWEIVEQCAPNNVQADVVMEMECSLGGLKDFSNLN